MFLRPQRGPHREQYLAYKGWQWRRIASVLLRCDFDQNRIERDISAALPNVKFHENPSGESHPDSADQLTCQRSQCFCERGQVCGVWTAIGTADVTMQRCAVCYVTVRTVWCSRRVREANVCRGEKGIILLEGTPARPCGRITEIQTSRWWT